MKKAILALLIFTAFGSATLAAECKLKITREPCPGQEATVLKPYGMKKETEETRDVPTESACKSYAETTARIVRKGTFSRKIVVANFSGQDLAAPVDDIKECK